MRHSKGLVRLAVGTALLGLVVMSRGSTAAAYDPDPNCQFHVMGSLYGDGGGNGAANGTGWNPLNTSWKLSNSNRNVIDRFERCARWMVSNDVGGNATAMVTRRNNSVTLQGFWPAGVSVAFPHGAMTALVAGGTPLQQRAFVMGVVDGEGEVCDPSNGSCATAQIADNSRSISGGTNPDFYKHIVALLDPAIHAGLSTAFTATASGCTPQTEAQLAVAGGAGLCIRSADYQVLKDWPFAACTRVPGYGHVAGYVCGRPDEPSGEPPPTTAPASTTSSPTGPAAIVSFASAPDPIPPGGPASLAWTTTGMDADTCKLRTGGTVVASHLPASSSWPIPVNRIRNGAKFTLICTAGGAKHTRDFVITVQ